ARVMKMAVAYHTSFIEALKTADTRPNGRIVLATVKGDVHDIGKNIVGVVLQCNNFEVIDLGVMVPAEKILATAREHDADMIGLSGLITPSLDEMVNVAKEMERQGFKIPLLIGGATTSRVHTAVKIAPNYSGDVVYVKDASRAVGVASSLLSASLRQEFSAQVREEYEQVRQLHRNRQNRQKLLGIEEARANRVPIDWSAYQPPRPRQPGIHVLEDYPLERLLERIDWTPFFHAWEL